MPGLANRYLERNTVWPGTVVAGCCMDTHVVLDGFGDGKFVPAFERSPAVV